MYSPMAGLSCPARPTCSPALIVVVLMVLLIGLSEFRQLEEPFNVVTAGWNRLPFTSGNVASQELATCCESAGRFRIAMIGDSNMRKRYMAVGRLFGKWIEERSITRYWTTNGYGDLKPFEQHVHSFTIPCCGGHNLSIGYAFWLPGINSSRYSSSWPGIPTIWGDEELKSEEERPIVFANYGLWSGHFGDEYCEELRNWSSILGFDQQAPSSLSRPFWITSTPVNLEVTGEKKKKESNVWWNHTVEFPIRDSCAASLGFLIVNGSAHFYGPNALLPDGYHIRPAVANGQAELMANSVCSAYAKGEL